MAKVTIRENEDERQVFDIEMMNTADQPELYSLVRFKWNGNWESQVHVMKDRKNGKRSWSALCAKRHRYQVAKVLDVVKLAGY